MSQGYDKITAMHYEAYRPPLHSMILKKLLPEEYAYDMGLDIGCGTGYSTIALKNYCRNVLGIDPSEDMVSRATANPGISYRLGSGEETHFDDNSVDIISFAGSLYYAKSEKLLGELRRISAGGAIVVAYDFKILDSKILQGYEIFEEAEDTGYDHAINFNNCDGMEKVIEKKERISIQMIAEELAHILLSWPFNYEGFIRFFQTKKPFLPLVGHLKESGDIHSLEVDIYYSKYRLTE